MGVDRRQPHGQPDPAASTSRWYLDPSLPRSTGLGPISAPWLARTSRLLLGLGAAVSAALLTARTVGLPGGYSEAGSPEANISLAVQLAFCGLAAFRFGQQYRSSRLA